MKSSLVGLAAASLLAGAAPARAQTGLEGAVDLARAAWLEHDVAGLVARSDTVRLRLPGIAVSASLQPEQAARLLERYLEPVQERSFDLVDVRRMAEDHAYAEIARRYVVKGTEDELGETVFLGFRFLDGAWRLREVRVTP
jgi:hypothetical protein